MDKDLITFLVPLGIGGALAGFMFYFYRLDFLRERSNTKILIQVLQENVGAMTSVAEAVREMRIFCHRNSDRRDA